MAFHKGGQGLVGINLAPRAPGAKTERECDGRDLGGVTRRPHMRKTHTLVGFNEFAHLGRLRNDGGRPQPREIHRVSLSRVSSIFTPSSVAI